MWSGKGIEPFAFTVWKINTFSQRQGRKCCWSRLICLFGNQGSAAVFCIQTWVLCWALLCLAASPDCSFTWLPIPRPWSLSLYCLLHLFPSTFLSFSSFSSPSSTITERSPWSVWATFSSVQFSHSVVSDSLRPLESQHARPPCPSPTPRVYSDSCPSSQWCHPAISSSIVPFSSCPLSLLASGSFPMSQLFAWGGQSIGVSTSASVLPMNTEDWSPLGWTGWISLQ